MNTVTRSDIVERVRSTTGLARAESSVLVEQLLELMKAELLAGNSLKLSGFGTFLVRQKAERKGRNPKTRDPMPIAARKVVVFRPSAALRQAMNREKEPVARSPKGS